ALPGEIGAVGAPPPAAAALRVGNLDGAALPPRHIAEEQHRAASPHTPAAATKPPTAVATEKRVPPASARSPQLDLQRKLLGRLAHPDRKSTRLNSSHDQISYAVFCLKKKKAQAPNVSTPH